jgi:hypothetical protein
MILNRVLRSLIVRALFIRRRQSFPAISEIIDMRKVKIEDRLEDMED